MKTITIIDNRSFEFGKDRNGGSYSYSETAIVSDSGQILTGRHSTSSDFPYCPFCGRFEDHTAGREACDIYIASDLMLDAIAGRPLPEGVTIQ